MPTGRTTKRSVEQKNGAVVRRLTGYGRFEGVETARVMARLYAAARLYINFFQPSFKLKEKRREGAKVIKRYHAPSTPCERALAHPNVAAAVKVAAALKVPLPLRPSRPLRRKSYLRAQERSPTGPWARCKK